MPEELPTYKEALLFAIDKLREAQDEIIDGAVNVAMGGPYRELSLLMEEGEEFAVTVDMLRDTGDVNVDRLLRLIDAITCAADKIANINAL